MFSQWYSSLSLDSLPRHSSYWSINSTSFCVTQTLTEDFGNKWCFLSHNQERLWEIISNTHVSFGEKTIFFSNIVMLFPWFSVTSNNIIGEEQEVINVDRNANLFEDRATWVTQNEFMSYTRMKRTVKSSENNALCAFTIEIDCDSEKSERPSGIHHVSV